MSTLARNGPAKREEGEPTKTYSEPLVLTRMSCLMSSLQSSTTSSRFIVKLQFIRGTSPDDVKRFNLGACDYVLCHGRTCADATHSHCCEAKHEACVDFNSATARAYIQSTSSEDRTVRARLFSSPS